jgi:4-amino-4-deoxy-L-arabinose transferase-like glycosyltransferase
MRPSFGLFFVLLLYVLLAIAFSQVMPFNKGPDEGINLSYINVIAAKGRLPITYTERDEVGPKANWPALYHLLVAGLSRLAGADVTVPPTIKIFWDSFRYRAIDTYADENPWYLLSEDQQIPYHGQILALHLGRWLSILFSAITIWLVYLIALELLPGSPWLAVSAATILAFIPQFIFIGASLNEDALVAALAAFYFWLLLRVIKQPERGWLYGLLGLVLGLSITVKYTTIVLPLEVVVVLTVLLKQRRYPWKWWWQRLALVGGATLLGTSWWFGWNFWFLNEVKELGLVAGLLRPIFTGGADVTLSRLGNLFSGGQIGLAALPENVSVGTFPQWVQVTFLSFWAVRIGPTIPADPLAYGLVGLLLVASLWGLWRLFKANIAARPWLYLLLFHLALFVLLPLVRFGLSRRLGQTAQGRHILIPAAAAAVILLVWGVVTILPSRWQRGVFPLVVAGFMAWTSAHLYALATFAAPLLPYRTTPQAAAWLSNPINAHFGDLIELVSYQINPQPEQGQFNVELAWRALAQVNESYLLNLALVDAQDQVVSHWAGYNGQGRLPTLAWDVGDSVFDRLGLPLPNLPPGEYTLQLQLVGRAGPLAVTKAPEDETGLSKNNLALSKIRLNQPSVLTFPHQLSLASADVGFAIWSATGPIKSPQPAYRYPATISLVFANTNLGNQAFTAHLVDPTGQAWPATRFEANIATFIIGPHWPSGNYRVQLTYPHQGAQPDVATSESLLTVKNWWPRQFAAPQIQTSLKANFANQLTLLGYHLPQNQVKAGQALPLTLYWQALTERPPQADFIQFNHLLDSNGSLQGGYDRRPLEYYSTLLWAPGEVVADGYTVPINPEAPPGQYYLNVGYYLTVGEAAVNLPLVVDGQMTDVTSVTIGPIDVVEP